MRSRARARKGPHRPGGPGAGTSTIRGRRFTQRRPLKHVALLPCQRSCRTGNKLKRKGPAKCAGPFSFLAFPSQYRMRTLQLLLVWKLPMPSNPKSKSPANDLAAILPSASAKPSSANASFPLRRFLRRRTRPPQPASARCLYRDLQNLLQREALLTVTAAR